MSCYCECVECGGKDEFAMCENGYMRAQIEGAKASQLQSVYLWAGISAFIVVMVVSTLTDTIRSLTTDWF